VHQFEILGLMQARNLTPSPEEEKTLQEKSSVKIQTDALPENIRTKKINSLIQQLRDSL